jgi:MoaA/NifB/PqqE/SkfB family radical SAM enzyme
MGKIVLELTNRCNLSCQHCFSGRHGGRDDLPLEILDGILAEARDSGFDHLSFTGGEPTIHPQFAEIVRRTCEAGYRFGFNSNGRNFVDLYPSLLPYRDPLTVITFSLDGATEETHDRLRGRGSYRRVMQAVSVCVVQRLPFTFNMVVTRHNRHELERMAETAIRLGGRGLRFGHLMPAPVTTALEYDLTPWERKVVEAEIHGLRRRHPIRIGMAPGYHTTDLFPCAPLQEQELNVDCHGNVTKCCHLSGHGDGVGQRDVIGNLRDMGFAEAHRRFLSENEGFRRQKLSHVTNGGFQDSDFFPCWYCSLFYEKVGWLKEVAGHPWGRLVRTIGEDTE